MSIIEASSVRVQTLADGTLRIVCDVEPRHARDAFFLFGAPGVPMALAALRTTQETQAEPETTPAPDKPKGGMWSQWCAMRCNETEFQDWLFERHTKTWDHVQQGNPQCTLSQIAAEVLRSVLDIASRAELDNNADAKDRFDKLIRGPWQKHYQSVHA